MMHVHENTERICRSSQTRKAILKVGYYSIKKSFTSLFHDFICHTIYKNISQKGDFATNFAMQQKTAITLGH